VTTNPNAENAPVGQTDVPIRARRTRFRRLLFGLITLALLAGVIHWTSSLSEPKYQGVSLGKWIERYLNNFDSEPQRNEAIDAVQHIGSNAVPCLMRWLTASDSTLKESIETWIDAHSPIKVPFTNEYISHYDRALLGFEILGPRARTAIPELERLMRETNTFHRARAARILCRLGPEAVPVLLWGLTNSNPDIRSATSGAIWLRMQETSPTPGSNGSESIKFSVPLLLQMLRDSDPEIRSTALQQIQEAASHETFDASSAVPVLIEQLKDPNLEFRIQAADVLGSLGLEATNAIPALVARLQDQAANVRVAVTNALKKINSDAATKAGVK
jgi:hypothetical protein